MAKTKSVRIRLDDAFSIEQASRELSAELQTEVKVSDLLKELVKNVHEARQKIKERFDETGSV